MSKYLLIALSILPLSACSRQHVTVPMPPPPASLAQPCPVIAPLPNPLIDPYRLQWELDVLNAYADCAARHRATVSAWTQAVQAAEK